MSGEIAPPTRLAIHTTLAARARCVEGNHREMLDAAPGYAPASPAPKAKRVTSSAEKLDTAPVSAVKVDHHNTIRVSTLRAPMRSAKTPEGISNSAYDSVNTPTTQPHLLGESPSSDCIRGP